LIRVDHALSPISGVNNPGRNHDRSAPKDIIMASPNVIELTSENFKDIVATEGKAVLVDVWAPWCGPCRAIAPMIDDLAEEVGGPEGNAIIAKLNTDDNQEIASALGISAIPTILIFRNGEVEERLVGMQPRERLLDAIA
jgi:thioredoxin 1